MPVHYPGKEPRRFPHYLLSAMHSETLAHPQDGASMVLVPAGPFLMGDEGKGFAYDNERPRHEVHVAAFEIDRMPVSNGQYSDFIADGGIEMGGRLPVNTHGGQLGEAYIHGMNGIAEAVRQLRGTSVNQLADVPHVLVTAGTGVPTSGLVLSS